MIISENKRVIFGAFILIIVNIVWVLSSELTNYIFVTEKYNKPFMSTYIKSSLFSIFLAGFLISSHWRMLACPHMYYIPTLQTDNSEANVKNILSDPIYVPINYESSEDEVNKKMDGDYVIVDTNDITNYEQFKKPLKRNVKFSKYSEVRHLSDTYAEDSLAARMSYSASKVLRKRLMTRKIIEQGYLPATSVMKIALQFCFLWFLGNYSYQIGLSKDSPAVVNVISCTSSLFTLILAALFPSTNQDKFNITKLVVVIFSMSGVVLLSFADYVNNKTWNYEGIVWSLISALGYAAYLVNLRRKIQNEDQMSFPMFFGFVGLWTVISLWPGLIILNLMKLETLELPNELQLGSMLLNGILGTLGAELLWLWGCFLTSSLTATLSLALTIPLSMVADYFIKQKVYDWKFYVGSLPVFFSFICIAYLSTNSAIVKDPIGQFLKNVFHRNRNFINYKPLVETDSECEDDGDDNKTSSSKQNRSNSLNSKNQMIIEEQRNPLFTRISNFLPNMSTFSVKQCKSINDEKKNANSINEHFNQ